MDKILRKEADIRKLLEDETRVKKASELLALMKAHREYNKKILNAQPNQPPSKPEVYGNVLQAPTVDDMMRSFQDSRRPRQIQNKDIRLKRLGLNEKMSTSSFSLGEKEPPNKSQAQVVREVLSWTKKSQAYMKSATMTEEETNHHSRTSQEQLVSESVSSTRQKVKLVNPKVIAKRKRRASRKSMRSRKQRAKRIMVRSPTSTTLSTTISNLESLNKLIEENKNKIEYVERQLRKINKPIVPRPPSRPPRTALGLIKKTDELKPGIRLKSKTPWDGNYQLDPKPKPVYLSQPNHRDSESDGFSKRLPRRIVRHLEKSINDKELLTLKPPPLSPKPSIGNQTSKNTIAWFKLNPCKSSGEKINSQTPTSRRPTAKEAIDNSERIRLGLQGSVKLTTKRVQGVLNISREVHGLSPTATEVKSTHIAPVVSKSGLFRTLFRRSGQASNSEAMGSNESSVNKGIFQRFWQGMKSILWKENRVRPM